MILDFTTYITSIVTTIIGVVGGFFAIMTYRENQTLKRQEIIFPLMREFDENNKIYYANELIDNVPIQLKHDNEVIANIPIKLRYCDEDKILKYKKDDLQFFLVGHLHTASELNQDEIVIRTIFDALLNFFGKLGYLIDRGIVTKRELGYFLYYIEKARDNWAVIHFAKDWRYELFAVLLYKIEIIPDDLQPLVKEYNERLCSILTKYRRLHLQKFKI